jgi:sorbitol/mannitol transport system permease protein
MNTTTPKNRLANPGWFLVSPSVATEGQLLLLCLPTGCQEECALITAF